MATATAAPIAPATPARRVVGKVDLVRKKGYIYFVDGQGDVSRTKRSTGHYSEKFPHEKVFNVGIKRVKGMWYFLDKIGSIVELKPKVGRS